MSGAVTGDTAMSRRLFVELLPAEQTAFLEGIRERRLASVKRYKELQAAKKEAKDERSNEKLSKEYAMMEKELTAYEKAITKLEERMNKIAALNAIIAAEL